ncbi:S-adenosyl-L-methionine-dependent methyltransferase [Diplogelasinospora grovesii]|uniref:S-adenosyl-L-methionine-dependent methyltransferase n=1 Tax=Diplogelasinospora grovesii TaxID=303347 RepID=A0AAN6N9E5_9PEZI|nr:S-adenosyl-L-methionine-dependent methyltransferase [Diplogelasinospora grovesii]
MAASNINGNHGAVVAAPEYDTSFAAQPADLDAVPGLLNDIAFLKGNYNLDLSANREARLYLLAKARSLVQALESPRETMLKHCGAETASFFMISLGIDVGLFHYLAKDNARPKKATEISKGLSFEVDGLRRILRHLAAMGHIIQTGNDEYKPNNFSKALTIPIVADGYPFYRSVCLPPMVNLHKWMKTKGYITPTTGKDNPFTFGNQTDMSMFEYMAAFPQFNQQFNHHMGGYRLGRPAWFDRSIYPVQQNLMEGFNPKYGGGAFMIDIGGNLGHDLERFRQAFPDHPGRLILQDQDSVIERVIPTLGTPALHKSVELMGHNFFTPEPVKGARCYYLHHILHDWPDDKCVDIVSHIKAAMQPGYSKLLVNEHIIPSMGASWEATYLDLYMMTLFGARERTDEDWRNLLERQCGLKITNIYNPGNGVEGIVECEVPIQNNMGGMGGQGQGLGQNGYATGSSS